MLQTVLEVGLDDTDSYLAVSFFGISGQFVIISALDSVEEGRIFVPNEDEDVVDSSPLLLDCFSG